MVRYANSQGHNWGAPNNDGYGISLIIFIVSWTIAFLFACAYLWLNRHHPVIRMRKINLSLMSVILLHVYLFVVFLVYPMNGDFPCGVEFWAMSLYLPIGIGLFQAANQQLLIVSNEQNKLLHDHEPFKPLAGERGSGLGTPRYWAYRFKLWWQRSSKQGRFEAFVLAGIIVQFLVSVIIYNISRKFNDYGIVESKVSPGKCREGWEWIPSIFWQFTWNYFFGPYLIWKIRMIRDIYHWRLQTILAVVAGLPGTPLWIAGTYTSAFDSVNKYWVPAMWLSPGIMMMQVVTVVFPIVQIVKHKRTSSETRKALAAFDAKTDVKQLQSGDPADGTSITARSTASKGRYSMESLTNCLKTNYDGLQVYASCMELNGENIMFLVKVLEWKRLWRETFTTATDFIGARRIVFRAALSIYVSLVNSSTAPYPINIESPVYAALEAIFQEATSLVACRRNSSMTSSISNVTPWDEPTDPMAMASPLTPASPRDTFHMQSMPTPPLRHSNSNESKEYIMAADKVGDPNDSLASYSVPPEFNGKVFDAAEHSVKYMVYCETWQRYMNWKRSDPVMANARP